MSTSAAPEHTNKKKHVRFARVEDGDEEQAEDTLFDKTKDTGQRLKSALKAVQRAAKPGREGRSDVCGRWVVSLALCGSFLGLGMSISILGPTFEDLAVNLKKNISNISYVFAGRAAGYIGGSLVGGVVFECMNPYLLLGFSMLITAVGMCSIPFCSHALLLTVFMSGIGMSMGTLDTGGNVLILNTWGDKSGPHMQALHFSFAAGAFMSPIIAKMLFGSNSSTLALSQHNSSALLLPELSSSAPPLPEQSSSAPPSVSSLLHYAHSKSRSFRSLWSYIIIGSFLFLMAFLFLVLLLCTRCRVSQARGQSSSGKSLMSKHHVALVILLFVFFFFYVGAEVAYGSFIFTFAKHYAHMSDAQAAALNSVFWGSFAACRGLSILFAACVYPGTLMVLSLLGSLLSSLLLCVWSRDGATLWLCSGLYGASMAATFPSGISWLEQYTTVTGVTASVFVVGAALGEMTLPALVGFLLGQFPHQPVLMFLSLITASITSILFPVMYKLATSPSNHSWKPRLRVHLDSDDSEYHEALLEAAANEEEEEQEKEAEQWNDADFEVIEMDDTLNLINSPSTSQWAGPVDDALPSISEWAEPVDDEQLLTMSREKRE
ncbi:sodium-dependent glucose transporter 1 [Gouania willdenowi]|uniref:Sodium-dependent glucose transporter 1 n=1 Tax=Gouania willdenowi TaxID=441366 RepID=A0A8C5IAN4_GOUWI|nr:sodium-dependent glucose transporter 1 [Gouania willdenowi]